MSYLSSQFVNRTIRIGVAAWAPYVNPCAVATKLDTRRCPYPGMIYEILIVMMRQMGLKYELIPYTKNVDWGTVLPNGSYVGLLGDVLDGRLDTIIPHYFVTSQRRQAGLDFSTNIPFSYSGVGFILREADISFSVETSYLLYKVFTPTVWKLIFIAGSLLILLLFFALNLYNWKHSRPANKTKQCCKMVDYSTLWRAITAALDQYSDNVSTGSLAGNQGMVLLGVLVLFVTTLYQGILVGILMNQSPDIPFDSQSSLNYYLTKGRYQLAKEKSLGDEAFYWAEINHSELSAYRELREILKEKPAKIIQNRSEILSYISKNPSFIYPGVTPINGGITGIRGHCNLQFIMDSDFMNIMMSFPWKQSNAKLKDMFSQSLGYASALISHIETRYVRLEVNLNKKSCPKQKLKEGDPLRIQHFSGVFTLFLIGLAAGLLVLLVEKSCKLFIKPNKHGSFNGSKNTDGLSETLNGDITTEQTKQQEWT